MTKFLIKAAGLILIGLAGVIIGWRIYYQNRVYPGLQIANINIGGLKRQEALDKVSRKLGQITKIDLKWGDRQWEIEAGQIGLKYLAGETINKAMAVRSWRQIKGEILTLEPVYIVNEELLSQAITNLVSEINIPAKEPEISLDKTSRDLIITPGENGQEVETRLLAQRIQSALRVIDNNTIEVPVLQLRPKLNEQQLKTTQARAQMLVGKKMTIKNESGGETWTVEDTQLLAWMDPQKPGWKAQAVESWVIELAKTVDRPAENASFRIVGEGKVEEFKPGKDGWRVNQIEMIRTLLSTLDRINEGQPYQEIRLVMEVSQPDVKTGEVNNFGIRELIGRGESWFSGSIDNRIFNIKKATETLNGMLVAPGETFSFNEKIGEVSQTTGYKPAYIIKDGKTVLGDGGGVCQVSSTLFRAVLRAGLPIKERLAHAYRVYYYEEKSEPGFDATVFQPSPDFKFVNDTPAYILIQTSFDAANKHVVFDLYGTSDGRKATISKARIWEVIPPPPDLYQEDTTKPVGYLVQMEHSAWGAKVAFDWKVTRGDEVLQDRAFYSNYAPWQAVYVRGTKQ